MGSQLQIRNICVPRGGEIILCDVMPSIMTICNINSSISRLLLLMSPQLHQQVQDREERRAITMSGVLSSQQQRILNQNLARGPSIKELILTFRHKANTPFLIKKGIFLFKMDLTK